jgi:hypothetical protein
MTEFNLPIFGYASAAKDVYVVAGVVFSALVQKLPQVVCHRSFGSLNQQAMSNSREENSPNSGRRSAATASL